MIEIVIITLRRRDDSVKGGDDGVVAAKKSGRRKHRGQKENAATEFGVAEAAFSEGHFALIHVAYLQAEWPASARATSEAKFEDCTAQRARTLEPPCTVSPTLTEISASFGSQMSTREPKRTRPMRSPRRTDSPGFFQETTRRAIKPAICLNSISPAGVASVKMFCSFCVEAFGFQAARNLPGRYFTCVMVPVSGVRLTCTFQIARKMLMRVPGRPAFSSSVMTRTRPSAGERTASGSGGMARSGSRKKEKQKAAIAIRTAAAIHQ